MTNAISARLHASASKIRRITSRATKKITGILDGKSVQVAVPELRIGAPEPGSFIHHVHIPARQDEVQDQPAAFNEDTAAIETVDDATTSEELRRCRRKLHRARSGRDYWMRAWSVEEKKVSAERRRNQVLDLQLHRSADLAATNRALRQEIMKLKTTQKAVRSKTSRQLMFEVDQLVAQNRHAADEGRALHEMLDVAREQNARLARVQLYLLNAFAAAQNGRQGAAAAGVEEGGNDRAMEGPDA